MRFLISLALLCVLSTVAYAKTIVIPSPAEGSDGSAEMDAGFDQLEDGDTLVFSKGTYSGTAFVFQKNDIRIVGKRGAVLNAEAVIGIIRLNECTNVTVTGLEFVCTTSAGVDARQGSNIAITACTFRGTFLQALLTDFVAGVTIEKCRFEETVSGVRISRTSDAVIQKNRFSDQSGIAMRVDPTAGSDAVITRNTFKRCGETTITVGNGDHEISRNKLKECGFIVVSGTGNKLVTHNKSIDGTSRGFWWQSGAGELSRNTIKSPALSGIRVEAGAGAVTIERNQISQPGEHGIFAGGDGVRFEKNKVVRATLNGFFVLGEGTEWVKNTTIKAGAVGFELSNADTGGTFTQNKAKKSADFDVSSDEPRSTYTFDGNTFGTESFPAQ